MEKKLFVEADEEHARMLAHAGVDGIQFDKIPVDRLAGLVQELRGIDPRLTLIAAGGVNTFERGSLRRHRHRRHRHHPRRFPRSRST